MKTKKIHNKKLAKQLLAKGFPIIDMIDSNKCYGIIVFVFEDTEALRKEIDYQMTTREFQSFVIA